MRSSNICLFLLWACGCSPNELWVRELVEIKFSTKNKTWQTWMNIKCMKQPKKTCKTKTAAGFTKDRYTFTPIYSNTVIGNKRCGSCGTPPQAPECYCSRCQRKCWAGTWFCTQICASHYRLLIIAAIIWTRWGNVQRWNSEYATWCEHIKYKSSINQACIVRK